ncbi:MAG TPA: hypothetical protein V6C71_23090 [Coleofasciculaceae cyanobacterium]|jgi:hypothetical protein
MTIVLIKIQSKSILDLITKHLKIYVCAIAILTYVTTYPSLNLSWQA